MHKVELNRDSTNLDIVEESKGGNGNRGNDPFQKGSLFFFIISQNIYAFESSKSGLEFLILPTPLRARITH